MKLGCVRRTLIGRALKQSSWPLPSRVARSIVDLPHIVAAGAFRKRVDGVQVDIA
jgi:hypothetical protein